MGFFFLFFSFFLPPLFPSSGHDAADTGAVSLGAGEEREGFLQPCLAPPTAARTYRTPARLPAPAAAPGELFTHGNSCDKGTKIARNDGKHSADRSAEKRGNEAVRKTELGAGHTRGGGSAAPARPFPGRTEGWAGSRAGEFPSTEGLLQRHCLT